MTHTQSSRIQEYIGDPVSDSPTVGRDKLEEIFQDIQADRNCPVALDREPGRHIRRDAGKDLGLRSVLYLRRALPFRQLAGRTGDADA